MIISKKKKRYHKKNSLELEYQDYKNRKGEKIKKELKKELKKIKKNIIF